MDWIMCLLGLLLVGAPIELGYGEPARTLSIVVGIFVAIFAMYKGAVRNSPPLEEKRK